MASRYTKVIETARNEVDRQISGLARGGGYAAGLSAEGYHGGYRDALNDVLLVLSGVRPTRRSFWNDVDVEALSAKTGTGRRNRP